MLQEESADQVVLVPQPLGRCVFDASSNLAFSTAPVASTKTLATTEKRLPSSVATCTDEAVLPDSSVVTPSRWRAGARSRSARAAARLVARAETPQGPARPPGPPC